MIVLPDTSETIIADLPTMTSVLSSNTEDHTLDFKDLVIEMVNISTSTTGKKEDDEFEVHLKTSSKQDWKFSKKGLEEFCRVIRYPTKNFAVLDDTNLLADMSYRLLCMKNGDEKVVVRYDEDYNCITHCYQVKKGSVCSPLFDSEFLKIITESPFFSNLTFHQALRNRDMINLTMIDHDMAFDWGKDTYKIGINVQSNQAAQKGSFEATVALLVNEENLIFVSHCPVSYFKLADVSRSVLYTNARDYLDKSRLHVLDINEDFTNSMLKLEESEIDSQRVGFLFRGMKGVSRKYRTTVFENYMITVDDEITDEPKPTDILQKEGKKLWNIFMSSSKIGHQIVDDPDSSFRINDPINLQHFSGNMLNEDNKIYTHLKFYV